MCVEMSICAMELGALQPASPSQTLRTFNVAAVGQQQRFREQHGLSTQSLVLTGQLIIAKDGRASDVSTEIGRVRSSYTIRSKPQ